MIEQCVCCENTVWRRWLFAEIAVSFVILVIILPFNAPNAWTLSFIDNSDARSWSNPPAWQASAHTAPAPMNSQIVWSSYVESFMPLPNALPNIFCTWKALGEIFLAALQHKHLFHTTLAQHQHSSFQLFDLKRSTFSELHTQFHGEGLLPQCRLKAKLINVYPCHKEAYFPSNPQLQCLSIFLFAPTFCPLLHCT